MNLSKHFGGGGPSDHSAQYPGFTKEQYAQRALDLIQSPADGKRILGYKNAKGQVVRYDKEANDYVAGDPRIGIATMFNPKAGERYFNRLKERDGIEDE